jgi:hypothetical protein
VGDGLIDLLGFVTGDVLWLDDACGLGFVEGAGVVDVCPCEETVEPEWPPTGVPLLPGFLPVLPLCPPLDGLEPLLLPVVLGGVCVCSASGVCVWL